MTLTPLQKSLVQDSFDQVVPMADLAAHLFYNRLFELDPTLRSLFQADLAEQRVKLMQMLQLAVRGLDNPDRLVPALRQLAIRHVGYQVRDEHYEQVGEALLWTLEAGLGAAYTADVHEAWVAVYGLIASVMKDAASEVMAPASAMQSSRLLNV